MSVRLTNTGDKLIATLGAALTIGTGDYSMGCWITLKGSPTANDLFALGDASPVGGVYLAFDADASNVISFYRSVGATPTAYSGSLDTPYWIVGSRSGTTARQRIWTVDGTKVHDQTATDSGDYVTVDTLIVGQNTTSEGSNHEAMNYKIHTGVAWSDAQCVVEMRHFDNQVTGGTDRIAFRLEDTTDTFDGLRALPKAGQAAIALTNTGVVDGASRPSALEPLGLRVRQVKHTAELNASATTVAATFGAAVLAGSVVDAVVGWGNAGAESPGSAADGTNTYNEITACRVFNSGNAQNQSAFYAANVAAGTPTVTVTFNGSRTFRMLLLTELAGVAVAPLDASVGTDATSTTTPTSTAVVPTTAGQAVLSTFKDYTNSVIGVTAYQVGAAVIPTVAGDNGIDMASQMYVRSVAHTQSPGLTLGAARGCLIATRTYKPLGSYGAGDNFDRANENPLASPWGAGGGGLGNLKVVSNAAVGVTTVADAVMRSVGATTLTDQWVAVVGGGGAGFVDVCPLVRCDGSGNAQGYDCKGNRFMYFAAGAFTQHSGEGLNQTNNTGKEIRLEVAGMMMAVWFDNVFQRAVTVAAGPSSGGVPGQFVYSDGDNGTVAAWAGGGLWDTALVRPRRLTQQFRGV